MILILVPTWHRTRPQNQARLAAPEIVPHVRLALKTGAGFRHQKRDRKNAKLLGIRCTARHTHATFASAQHRSADMALTGPKTQPLATRAGTDLGRFPASNSGPEKVCNFERKYTRIAAGGVHFST